MQAKIRLLKLQTIFFKKLDDIFHFTIDICASSENSKCSSFYTEEDSCLEKEEWHGVCWMNPPYYDMKKFIQKAFEQRNNATIVCLIPARTNTKWWHEFCMKGEIWFIQGRPKFKGCLYGLPQPLALVIFGRESGKMKSFDLTHGLI